ncbi:MAG TPA: YbaB/EbfC family nucleoid-associated protein [Planctomycetota bacterium]|nr:YbaB/EbfC family nucleoid-associated protein [Planctomycetota bacterium]
MKRNDVGDLLKQMSQMRKKMDRVQGELKERYVEASVGDGRVRATLNGQQEIVKLSIDPELVKPDEDGEVDISMLEDLVIAAINQGVERSKALMNDEMDKASGGLFQGMGFF